ncbi:MAG: hypothetical protein RIQ81_2164 [Pseudomonadota bacterium]|jgi:CrcB protein
MKALWVALFGVVGVMLRWGCNEWSGRVWESPFPWVTFAINIAGSFMIGIVYVLGSERGIISPDLRFGIMTGLLGGFTTFSAYSLEVIKLIESGNYINALLYLAASPALGVAAAATGIWLMR